MTEAMAIPLPGDAEAPAFREPWQAKAFALVVLLHRQGRFGWDEWVRVLVAEIAAAPQQPGEHAEAAYHRQFLAALERVVAARGLAGPDDQRRRTEEWRRAYRNTPHGRAVELAAAATAHDAHDHDVGDALHQHGLASALRPVAVSPARARPGADR